jgi:hypothetical protein
VERFFTARLEAGEAPAADSITDPEDDAQAFPEGALICD